MNFAFSDEQEELRRYARQWLGERMPTTRVRALMATDDGFDRAQWVEVAEMGWQAMAIPEQWGGAGFGFLELAVLLEEQGRALFCGPFLSTVVAAATAIAEGGSDEQCAELLAPIASGERTAAVAVAEDSADERGSDMRTAAVADGDGWTLTGTKRFVLDGHTADDLIVAAQTVDGVGLFVVPGSAPGVTRTPTPAMDATRKLADVTLDEVSVGATGRLRRADVATLEKVADAVAVALALEAVGGAQATLEMAVEYAKDRQQFGKPIGSFQAIKHKCADMAILVESAQAAARYAAWTFATGSEEQGNVAHIAKAHCTDAFYRCAAENIQVHGGIGFTWEHDAHLYFKRAATSRTLFGSPEDHRRALADSLGF